MQVVIRCVFMLAAILLNSTRASDVTVSVGSVKDVRATKVALANLEVELNLWGADLDGVCALRCTVTQAVDSIGGTLVAIEPVNLWSRYYDISPTYILRLKSPARTAAHVREIGGEIELYKPNNDSASVVTVTNFVSRQNQPLSSSSLTTAGLEMTILSGEECMMESSRGVDVADVAQHTSELVRRMLFSNMTGGSNCVLIRISDPQGRFIRAEFLDTSMAIINQIGSMTVEGVHVYQFSQPMPQDAVLQVYVATPQSLIRVPLTLKDIPLP